MGGERTLRLIFYDDAYLYAIQTSIHLLILNLNILASSFAFYLAIYLPPRYTKWISLSLISLQHDEKGTCALITFFGSQCYVLELVGGSPTIIITQHTLTYCTIHALFPMFEWD